MGDLERAWHDFEGVCHRALALSFGRVDLAPMRSYMDIPDDVAALWEKRYPERPIQLDELLFPRPLVVGAIIDDRHRGTWPRTSTLCSDPGAGHFGYQLCHGRMLLRSDEEPWDDALDFDRSPGNSFVSYPSLTAFVCAVSNTLALIPEEAFETRSTKRWFRERTTIHFKEGFCRQLQERWEHPGFPPLVLRASVGTVSLDQVVVPPAYADLMRDPAERVLTAPKK